LAPARPGLDFAIPTGLARKIDDAALFETINT
jgi:hypothetical protein